MSYKRGRHRGKTGNVSAHDTTKEEGRAILLISEELPELLGMSDRILIMKDGQISHEFMRSENLTDADVIGYMI